MSASDLELLQAWNDGDARAGDRLFSRYFACVARFFRNKVAGDLEDLVQQTFLGCLEGRARFRGDGSFRSFLFGVAYRVLGTYYRRKYRVGERVDVEEVSLHDLQPGPSLLLAKQREHQLLLDALRQIPIAYQTVLELSFWEEMTSAEIAEALQIPHGTAQTRLRRARELLAGALERSPGARATGGALDFDAWVRSLRAQMVGAAS